MESLSPTLRGAVVVAVVAALGNALLAIAHTGLTVPGLSALGPEGRAVPPAVVGFTVTTVLFSAIAVGLLRRQRWAWIAGLVVSGLAVLSGLMQFRGVVSGIGIAVAVVLAALLLAPGSRQAIDTPGQDDPRLQTG